MTLCFAAMLLQGACAPHTSRVPGGPSALVTMPVRVTNESAEVVHVFFVSDAGDRLRIGTVSPYATAVFTTRLNGGRSGLFQLLRFSERGPTTLQGAVEPYFLDRRQVVIRVGAISAFDFWQVADGR